MFVQVGAGGVKSIMSHLFDCPEGPCLIHPGPIRVSRQFQAGRNNKFRRHNPCGEDIAKPERKGMGRVAFSRYCTFAHTVVYIMIY